MDLDLEDLPDILIKASASAFITCCIFLIGVIAGALTEIMPLLIVSLALFGLWITIAVFAGAIGAIAAIWILL